MIALLVAVLVAGLVLLADRPVAHRTEDQIARSLQTQLSTPQPPEVEVGFPVLLQLLLRRFRTVHVVAEDALLPGDDAVSARRLDLELSDVSRQESRLTAAHVTGTATLDVSALPKVNGQQLTYAGDGRVTYEVTAGSPNLPALATITGRPELDPAQQTVSLAEPKVVVGGVQLPAATAGMVLASLLKPVPVTGLPPGLRLDTLSVDDEGVQVALSGQDVTFEG